MIIQQDNEVEEKTKAQVIDELHEEQLSPGQRIAGTIAEFSGTITFFSLNALVFAFWIVANTMLPPQFHYDQYPFQFLTMAVSLEAIFLSIFVLISQNHQSRKDRITAQLDYQTDVKNGQTLEVLQQELYLVKRELHQTKAELLERLLQVQEQLQSTQWHHAAKHLLVLHELFEGMKPSPATKGKKKKNDTVTGTTSPSLAAVRVIPSTNTTTINSDGAVGADAGTN